MTTGRLPSSRKVERPGKVSDVNLLPHLVEGEAFCLVVEGAVVSSVWDRGGIFISYRRKESDAIAERLYERLSTRFGEDRVFRDVDSIAFGVDYITRIIGYLAGCNVLLPLIGSGWSAITDSKGIKRLDNPDDWVRIEIETALQRDIRVVPVLVDGTALPNAQDLPPSLQPLVRRQAINLHQTSFESDVQLLIADINVVIERRQPSRLTIARVHAPRVNVPALAEVLRLWYENQGLEAITVPIPAAVMVQCRRHQRSMRASGMDALLTVVLQEDGKDLLVEIGSAKWWGTISPAKATGAGAGLAVASLLTPPIAPVAAGAAAVGIGVRRSRQYRLSNQTIAFLREMAPTHVQGG